MARQNQQLTYNSFTGGIITEASPLTFPDNASVDESNFNLTKSATRERRLGLDTISKNTTLKGPLTDSSNVTTHLWENTGATSETFLVVGLGGEVFIYDTNTSTPGDRILFRVEVPQGADSRYSFASRSGSLIIVAGTDNITVVNYIGNNIFTTTKERLRIRDRIGTPMYIKNDDWEKNEKGLLVSERADVRPTSTDIYAAGSATVDVVYDFATSTELIQETEGLIETTRWELKVAEPYPTFMGFPIESFTVTREINFADVDNPVFVYYMTVVFKEEPYFNDIATNLVSGTLSKLDGSRFRANLEASEFGDFILLSLDLILTEKDSDFSSHIYNLWNQGWGVRRLGKTGTDLIDPIPEFFSEAGNNYPSMADTVGYALYPDSSEESNRTADRFHAADLVANPPGTLSAPRGRYVIDALDRGTSRYDEWKRDMINNSVPDPSAPINEEKTQIGARAVAEYSGRIWYAGFANDSTGGTLRLSNKVLYSQTEDTALTACYQEADPTSPETSDLVATDGGWVNIDEMDTVYKMVPIDTALLVFASNGVWAISGNDGNMFSPTSSMVTKLTTKGAVNSAGVVSVDKDVYYWADDGLYKVTSGGFAQFGVESLTKATIHELITELSAENFKNISGVYDDREERVLWIIDGGRGSETRRILILNLLWGSFTINTVFSGTEASGRYELLSLVKIPGFASQISFDNVVAGDDNVIVGADVNVVLPRVETTGLQSSLTYLTLFNDGEDKIVFSDTVREDFRDWGINDAEAYMVAGYVSGGDTARQKQVTYLTCHFDRTETVATDEGIENESSCKVQSQWEWTDSAYSNKWGTPFQAYRLLRPQIRGIGEEVAEGITVVTTKNKLRGRGRVLSLKFCTEPDKDCKILGWSMIMGANGNV